MTRHLAPTAVLGSPDPARFRSVTVPLPAGHIPDAVDFVAGPGARHAAAHLIACRDLTIAARGAAVVLPIGSGGPDARGWLDAVPRVDDVRAPGSGPLALGALPFSPSRVGALTVARRVVVHRSDGSAWVTAVAGPDDELPTLGALMDEIADLRGRVPEAGPDPEAGDAYRAHRPGPPAIELPDEDAFTVAAGQALEAIERGEVAKVVLSGRADATFAEQIDPRRVLRRLRADEPSSTVFAVGEQGRWFLGASPELLVARTGLEVTAHPLAGTTVLTGDVDADRRAVAALSQSSKDTEEHRIVVAAVAGTLRPRCATLTVPPCPSVIRLRSVAHLATRITGTLVGPSPDIADDVLSLARALHPTPAVAGSPTGAALELLARLEPSDRGRYAGPVGWMDGRGDGAFVVGIRSMTVAGRSAWMHAGAGIVAGSDPGSEFTEVTWKLRTALGALTC